MTGEKTVAERRRARATLARRLGRRGELMKGSLSVRWTRCGRAGCGCAEGKKHGPYLYVSVFREGRTRSVYVPQHLEGEVRQWVANAQAVERDVAEITWINAALLRQTQREKRQGRKSGAVVARGGRRSGR